MGYRHYIGKVSKEQYNKLKVMSKDELYSFYSEDPKDGHVGAYDICQTQHELGKYIDYVSPEMTNRFFNNDELEKDFNQDTELYVVGRDFLSHVINVYKSKIKSLYDGLIGDINANTSGPEFLKQFTDIKITEMFLHIRNMAAEWRYESAPPFRLDDGKAEISSSWKYEHSIFELVRIYKSFDWENDILCLYAY